MQELLKKIFILLLLQNFIILKAQTFEGEIIFVKQTKKDTSYFSYKIKGDKVRFEELNSNMQLDNYRIIDLEKKNIIAVNPKKKLFTDLPIYPWRAKADTSNFNIIKTGIYKLVKGHKCFQWRVQNKKEDTEVSFWFTEEDFDFYPKLQKMLNPPERTSQYYLNIPETLAGLPFESTERSMLREWRMCFELVKIEKKTLQASLFEIPTGYTLFQKN